MYNKRPIIGVMPLYDAQKESYWMLPGYMKGVEKEGAITLMLPLTNDMGDIDYFIDTCDGFILTGGQDVHPSIYGAKIGPKCGETCIARDLMEKYLLEKCIEKDKPVLGICRGIQIMNAALGGELYQDIDSEYKTDIKHVMQKPYDKEVHKVELSGPIKKLLNKSTIGVNSYHHQAVKKVADKLKVMAISEDGLIEGVYVEGKRFIWGIQWHPEFSYLSSEESGEIFREFVKLSKKK